MFIRSIGGPARSRTRSRNPARSGRRGVAIVEAAFILIITLMLLFGRFMATQSMLMHGVREGARLAAVNSDQGNTTAEKQAITDDVLNKAKQLIPDFAEKLANFKIEVFPTDPVTGARLGSPTDPNTWQDVGFSDYVTVQATGDYVPLLPKLFFGGRTSFPIRCQAMMFCEAN